MIILGILLLAAVAVAAVETILANDSQINFTIWRWTWHFDAFWLVVGGAALLAVALLGLSLLKAGSGRARRLRRERRELGRENRRLAERAQVAEATAGGPAEGYPRHQDSAMPPPADGFVGAGHPTSARQSETYPGETHPATYPAGTQPEPTGTVAADGQREADTHADRRG